MSLNVVLKQITISSLRLIHMFLLDIVLNIKAIDAYCLLLVLIYPGTLLLMNQTLLYKGY